MKVGEHLKSQTAKLEHVIIDNPEIYVCPNPELSGKRLVIVDTPGFDDTYTDDVEILGCISAWLAKS